MRLFIFAEAKAADINSNRRESWYSRVMYVLINRLFCSSRLSLLQRTIEKIYIYSNIHTSPSIRAFIAKVASADFTTAQEPRLPAIAAIKKSPV